MGFNFDNKCNLLALARLLKGVNDGGSGIANQQKCFQINRQKSSRSSTLDAIIVFLNQRRLILGLQ